jgi:hypothetical protein
MKLLLLLSQLNLQTEVIGWRHWGHFPKVFFAQNDIFWEDSWPGRQLLGKHLPAISLLGRHLPATPNICISENIEKIFFINLAHKILISFHFNPFSIFVFCFPHI